MRGGYTDLIADRIHILGVPIDAVTADEAKNMLLKFALFDKQHHVMTPNPEMLVEAKENPDFKALLQRTSLNLPDGFGLLLATRRQGKRLPARVTGADVLEALCSDRRCPPVFLLGAAEGIAEEAARALRKKNPALKIAGTFPGSPHPGEERAIVDRINRSGASVLFVAFGSPVQDFWIDRNLRNMPKVHLAMGVGGAFDFLSGNKSRAPQWVRRAGLEWSWRLLKEPKRLRRILTATVIFPFLAFREKHPQPTPPHGGVRRL